MTRLATRDPGENSKSKVRAESMLALVQYETMRSCSRSLVAAVDGAASEENATPKTRVDIRALTLKFIVNRITALSRLNIKANGGLVFTRPPFALGNLTFKHQLFVMGIKRNPYLLHNNRTFVGSSFLAALRSNSNRHGASA